MRHVLWIATIILMLPTATLRGAMGPGRVDLPLLAGQTIEAGSVMIHNNNGGLIIDVQAANGWKIAALHVHAGWSGEPVPLNNGNPVPGAFQFNFEYGTKAPITGKTLELDFAVALKGFRWGQPYEPMRTRHIAIHADVVKLDTKGKVVASETAWAKGNHAFTGSNWGWWLEYGLTHKAMAHFVDSPVRGVRAVTPTVNCLTDDSGGFEYFPGERVTLSVGSQLLGSTDAEHRITPIDLFDGAGIDDPRVGNMARLLQSLDADADPKAGISITPQVVTCFETALGQHGRVIDWNDSARIDNLIASTISACSGVVSLQAVSLEDALENLERSVGSSMFRKNVSKTPDLGTDKSKLDFMNIRVPATKANGEPVMSQVNPGAYGVDYFDDDGNYLYTREKVHPLVAVYADQIAETGAHDTFGAVSRDDGATWKRTNLSRAADRSSFELANGLPFYGDVKKPNLSTKGNYILAAWQSKFCRGGRPRYSYDEFLEDGVTPNPRYVDDIWGVGGPQRSHDYTEDGFPEVGELPFYCLWAARGVVDPFTGDIKWRKPERLTSGRRDVYQLAVNGANNVGFGIVWQEDPEGVRPGEMAGPGHGWSGATTNHKTDIWYASIAWSDFAPIDESFDPRGDPAHEIDDPDWVTNRPMPLVPFSLPIRISDNDVCNTDNMKVELGADGLPLKDADGKFIPINDPSDPEWDGKHTGTHRYAYEVPGLCTAFHTFVNTQGVTKNVCITADGRLLDGDTGASRPNLAYMPYTKADGTQSAWVAIVYEETKGVGSGRIDWDDDDSTTHQEEKAKADLGKNVIYHSFEFSSPVRVHGGDIVNLPARDAAGNLLYLVDENKERILDWQEKPQIAYQNARRPRMLVQPAGQAGFSGTVMVMVYKEGEDGKGRPSDIMLRRVKKGAGGNPYAFANFTCNQKVTAENGKQVCVDGALNMSSVTPTEYWTNPNQDDNAKGEGIKVVKYEQRPENLNDASWTNPYEDARSHRGILRGDNIFFGYDYTPNWAASRNAHDKYDLFFRRSFDGGVTWKTDPQATSEVCHTRIWKDYSTVSSEDDANGKDHYEEVECFAPGVFEPGRNMSMMKNNKLSVIEPRIVGVPSSTPGSSYPEDKENKDVYYVTFGTATNVPKAHGNDDDEEEEEHAAPADLYYTFSRDRGQTYFKRLWEVNPDSSGNWAGLTVERYDYLAKGDPEQGEAQIRMVPDGSRFYAVWNEESVEESDTWFRRIMSSGFPQNVGTPLEP